MDLANIFFVTTLLVFLSISGVRSAKVTLSKSAEKGQLGNNSISLFCDYILSAGDRVFTIDLKRKRAAESGFYSIVSYYEDGLSNASYYLNGSDLVGRTVLTNPSPANRKAILQFNSVQCADEADYRCELFYAISGQGNSIIYSDIIIVVTATPTFANQSLLYTPSTILAENQTVTFTCIGNVGREPQGTFSWYKYIGGQSPGMVITNGINPISLVNVAGSCTSVRTEIMALNLTKYDNQMVIRCTVQQTTMTEAGDGSIQTDRINVFYPPRIMYINSDPDLPIYSEGMPLLMLICNADSNPSSNYVWTLPNGTTQTGYQLRLTTLTTSHSGTYMCLAYTGWGGVNYTANKSINITVALNATTAPLVLQRSDVECQTTSLKIFVPKNLVPGNGTVTWRDSACVVHSNGTHFVDSVGLRDCGTTLTLEADSVVFENDLILHKNGTQMQNGNSIVTYGSDYEFAIPVKCVYPRNSNISTSYIPIVQQVRIMERRNGQLDLTMRQYEAEDYRHPVPFNAYPRQVPLNNDIFIRLAMENNVTGLGLSADNCFATSTPSPVDQNWYQLISSGCPVNNAKIHPSGINDVKFSFHAFNFRHNTSGIVYVHCQVSVCLDTDPACVVGCMTRKKRSASAREGAITSNLISTGPFILAADEGGVAMSTVVAAVSIAAAVIATVVAIIGWTRKSKKGADS